MGWFDGGLTGKNKFLAMLIAQAAKTVEGIRYLESTLEDVSPDAVDGSRALAEEAAELRRVLIDELHKTFVTPLDREDLHALTSALENTLDNLDGTAERLAIYGIDELTEPMRQLVSHITEATTELSKAVACLKDMTRVDLIQLHLAHVNRLESEADAVYRKALGDLFAGKEPIDAVTLVRNKDLLEVLENTVDVCAHAMTVIRTLIIKNL